eukprot:UN28343
MIILGQTNSETYSELFYAEDEEWQDHQCQGETLSEGTPKFMYVTVRLQVLDEYDFEDGIDLYENWEDWLDKWITGTNGHTATYIPTTEHCDSSQLQGSSNSADCEATEGCSYSDGVCSPTPLAWPGAIPNSLKSVFVTDEAYFSFYFPTIEVGTRVLSRNHDLFNFGVRYSQPSNRKLHNCNGRNYSYPDDCHHDHWIYGCIGV